MSGESSSPDKDVQATKKMKEKTEPRFIVYLRETVVKLTSRNLVSIERAIKTRFNDVKSIHPSRSRARARSSETTFEGALHSVTHPSLRHCHSPRNVVAVKPFRNFIVSPSEVYQSIWPRRRSRTRQERH